MKIEIGDVSKQYFSISEGIMKCLRYQDLTVFRFQYKGYNIAKHFKL